MGRAPCCSEVGILRGAWTPREDTLLTNYIQLHGPGNWRSLPKKAGLQRCGKICRLRWMNYLRPDIKRGNISPDEEDLIIRMHSLLGNRWALIAGRLPGRTDNEIKNYWNTTLSKKLRGQGTDPFPGRSLADPVTPGRKRNYSTTKLEPEEPKIHLPRAVRFTSLTLPIITNNNTTSQPSSQLGNSSVNGTPWFHSKDSDDRINFLVGDDFFNCSDLEFQITDPLPSTDDNNLQKMFDEYMQLLNADDQLHFDSSA